MRGSPKGLEQKSLGWREGLPDFNKRFTSADETIVETGFYRCLPFVMLRFGGFSGCPALF